jgi:hypothetical protein
MCEVCFRRPEQNRPHILSRHLAMSKSAASEKRPAAGPFPNLAAGERGVYGDSPGLATPQFPLFAFFVTALDLL